MQPFGEGMVTVVVPQLRRGENSLLLWSLSDLTNPVHTFIGHTDVVLEFDWKRNRQDDDDYQLVTWSKDQSLRIWRVDTNLQKVIFNLKLSGFFLNYLKIEQLCGYEPDNEPPTVFGENDSTIKVSSKHNIFLQFYFQVKFHVFLNSVLIQRLITSSTVKRLTRKYLISQPLERYHLLAPKTWKRVWRLTKKRWWYRRFCYPKPCDCLPMWKEWPLRSQQLRPSSTTRFCRRRRTARKWPEATDHSTAMDHQVPTRKIPTLSLMNWNKLNQTVHHCLVFNVLFVL